MRKCHLNTCPVGIATQDPELRKKFAGKPEHVVNFFFLLAEELREIMAQLGFRTINEMVGRVDRLDTRKAIEHWKAKGLDFSAILHQPKVPVHVLTYCAQPQDHGLERSLDMTLLLDLCKPALEREEPVKIELPIRNVHRTVGTILSSEVTRKYGRGGFKKEDTIQLNFRGSAGQSLMAFAVHGVTARVEGDVNDYCGKGLSGGKIIVYPPRESTFVAEENIIAGNVVLYGATSGELYLRGMAGERFCVRNSGASAVVEGVGDHGCEYMTGGRAVILGKTGRNFAAGMSGGIAYVLDLDGTFPPLVNKEMVELEDAQRSGRSGYRADPDPQARAAHAQRARTLGAGQLERSDRQICQDHADRLQACSGGKNCRSRRCECKRKAGAKRGGMGDVRGFIKYGRNYVPKEPVAERLKHYNEFLKILPSEDLRTQGARCMDCGIPFCHTGCPLGNIIPDWNDLVYRDHWREALDRLHATNNFPEFTGRVCPAPCEAACVLGINEDPVAIKQIEMAIADRGFDEGWIVPEPPATRTGKKVAVVGSGPAGLAAAQQLNRAGHLVTVFERADRPGGLLMYGIPDFKLEKSRVWRRIEQMRAEGVEFRCNANVGVNVSVDELRRDYDALLLTGGATHARDLAIPGRELAGIHFAMEFLPQQNKINQGDAIADQILATGKHVIVIGGGDTGSDCTGTSNRQGCASLTQFELFPAPPDLGQFPRAAERPAASPWPNWPMILRTSTSHEEGCERQFSIETKEFLGDEAGKWKAW